MNTGKRNAPLGRIVYRGPKGGEYVLDVHGRKIYKFKLAPAPTVPDIPGFTKTRFTNSTSGLPIYRKESSGRYYVDGKTRITKTHTVKNASGVTKTLENHLKVTAVAPAAPTLTGFTKTFFTNIGRPVYRKDSSGRYYVNKKTITLNREVRNSSGTLKTLREHLGSSKKKKKSPVPVVVPASVNGVMRMPTPSPRPVITSAERNRRLAEIRDRLNAIRVMRAAMIPRTRANVEARLREVVRRRRRAATLSARSKTIRIDFCHAPASVPRRGCTSRRVDLTVYTSPQPLIESGAVVAMQESDFDLEWFKRQDKYISKLSDYDFWTVQAHTNRSHSWIGPYTYEGRVPTFNALGGYIHITPLWPQLRKLILNGTYRDDEQWVKNFKQETDEKKRYALVTNNLRRVPTRVKRMALDLYKSDLKRIIAHAPRSKKKMILYRGTNFDLFKGTRGHWHKLRSFCSAAYNVSHALGYGSLLQRITVLPGTPVLCVAGTNQWNSSGEYEVMVNLDTQYLIRGRNVKKNVYTEYSARTLRVTDITIAK